MSCCLANGFLTLLPSAGVLNILGESINLRREFVTLSLWTLLFAIGCVEWGVWWIRESLAMRNIRGGYSRSNTWTRLAELRRNVSLVLSGIVVPILMIVLVVGLIYFVIILTRNSASLPMPFWVLLGACVAYALLRIPLWFVWRLVGGSIGRLIGFSLPTYRLTGGGVAIELHPVQVSLGGRRLPTEFHVSFDELDEVQHLSYVEAQTYRSYVVGPDVGLWFRQTKEYYQFPVSTSRPKTHLGYATIFGTHVLLRGPGLLYLFCFNTNDASDLIDAFQQHKGL